MRAYHLTHPLTAIGVLTISRQVEALGDMEAVVMVELIGHLLEGPSMAAFAIGAVEG